MVLWGEPAGAEILRKVGPIAVGTNPDFDERRLIFRHGTIAGGCKRRNTLPRPYQGERAGHFHSALVADADGMDVAFDHGCDFAFLHSRADVVARIFHSDSSKLIDEAHARDFLAGLDHANVRQQRRGIYDLFASATQRVKITLRIDGRLANHTVANLRALRELDSDTLG